MKQVSRYALMLLCLCLMMCMVACNSDSNKSTTDNSQINTDNSQKNPNFEYPDESDFSLSVKAEKTSIQKGEMFAVNCILTNNTDKDFYAEHGKEVITYSYNNSSENIDQIAVLSTFKSKSEINRTLNIEASSSGVITITATMRIKPSRYSDSSKVYTYTEKINVIVE